MRGNIRTVCSHLLDELTVGRRTARGLFGTASNGTGPIAALGRFAARCLLVLAMWGTASTPVAASVDAPPIRADRVGGYATDQIIVRFHPDAMVDAAAAAAAAAADPAAAGPRKRVPVAKAPQVFRVPQLDDGFHEACQAWQVAGVRPCFARGFGNPDAAVRLGLDRTYILDVPAGTDAASMVASFEGLAAVESASTVGIGSVAVVPNDPQFVDQWHLLNSGQTGGTAGVDIGAPEAWDIHSGVPGAVTIAIVDNGVTLHEDYADLIVNSINTVDLSTNYGDTDPPSSCPHGTHVAGIAAAMGNNGLGVSGMYWGANILRARVLNGCGGTWPPVADGIIWATDNGADVINVSLQFYNLLPNELVMFEAAVDYAHDNGVFVVAAAGNWAGFDVAHPAEFENVMAVAATTDTDNLAIFSNKGPELSVAAPGEDIWSTWPQLGNKYEFNSGTSMASPVVAGLAALIKSYLPGATPDDIWALIEDNVIDLGTPGHDIEFGHGRIDALATMTAASLVPRMVVSAPVSQAIDARQPSSSDGLLLQGWHDFKAVFSQDPTGLTISDFEVNTEGGSGFPPAVLSLESEGFNTLTISLHTIIPVTGWTTVAHTLTGTDVTLGFLPGDVNSSGLSDGEDILTLIDSFDGLNELVPYQTDMNRDGESGPEDLLRLIDLMNGAEAYDAYFGVSLP